MRAKLIFVALCIQVPCFSQQVDSVYHQLQEVEIRPVSPESQLRSTAAEASLGQQELHKQQGTSFVAALNTVPGVRMEERSPGSYRFSIRGSLIRSPFGVRNVKVYLADLPFTDGGGNTYLNSLDLGAIYAIKVLKGPEASIFGANTGGVLQLDPVNKSPDTLRVAVSASAGSFGLFHNNASVKMRSDQHLLTVSQAYQKSNGYRTNSAMARHYLQLTETWFYKPNAQLRILALASDLQYETPGALTLEQYKANPAQARPGTTTLPGAVQQKAAIFNQTVFGGLTHDVYLAEHLRHVISVFGSHTRFKNPFISNYEERQETSTGARTYFDGSYGNQGSITGKWNLGAELQQSNAAVSNFGNKNGVKDSLQAGDRLKAQQAFLFGRFLIDLRERVLIEISASYNFFNYRYKNTYPQPQNDYTRIGFDPSFMPRLAASLKLSENLSWRLSVSRGYSSPTLAELRSSDNVVNKDLQAETGISYETGLRLRDHKDYLWIDLSAFYYSLKNAIVRRVNADGAEYFVNAGSTRQPGIETQMNLWIIQPRTSGFLRSLQVKGNLTFSPFTFDNYLVNGADYSGNALTGVPRYTSSESVNAEFIQRISIYIQYYYSSAIFLNDANSAAANEVQLLQLKAEWQLPVKRFELKLSGGVDNALNKVYSLGNDLNAAGGRYFNAAMPRNYFCGLKIAF